MKREYPSRPVVGVGAVILAKESILLVKRGSHPGINKWSIPGGLVELGESVRSTIIREVKEESNLEVEVESLIDVVDNIIPDQKGDLRYHFVILDFLTHLTGGELKAGSDVMEVKWVPLSQVEEYDLTHTFRDFFKRNHTTLMRLGSKRAKLQLLFSEVDATNTT